MKQITLIRQQDDTGCGIACVAMLASVHYEEVRKKLFKQKGWTDRRSKLWTRAGDLMKLSRSFDLRSEKRIFSCWGDIEGCAIIGVKPDNGVKFENGYFHWVVTIKTSQTFLILDPQYGDVYQGEAWAEDGYMGRTGSFYLLLPGMKLSGIKIC